MSHTTSDDVRTDENIDSIEYLTRYDDGYAPLFDRFGHGDLCYFHYFGEYGHSRQHGVVSDVRDDGTVVVQSRTGGEYRFKQTADGVTIDGGPELESVEEDSIYHVEYIPEDIWLANEWSSWEVHLVVSLGHESSDDEVLFPEARSQEEAVRFARRRSDGNPPKVGPVYEEGDPNPVDVDL